ncbi:MAG: type IV secretion system DNA-binding domain-containing protein [Xanthobacteraceae bacterium]|nr:type IV secretion system DNA-binding domain-containing protein [Xanthobacteraceae bacterium]
MGADLVDDSDCEAAADQAVDQTGERIWGKTGATLYAGCMISTKGECDTAWGAPELYRTCLLDPLSLKDLYERYYPEAARLIEIDKNGDISKTSISFLLTFRGSVLRTLRPLAHAWADVPPERQFSFSAWVTGDRPNQPRIVIVQRSGRHPEMSAAWIGMVMDTITNVVGDPQFSNSRTRTRSFILDEAPALGALRRWAELLDTGRNKGAATYAAIQDVAQFRRLYREAADSIFQRFATKIICAQTYGPETKALAENEIGKREVLEKETTTTVDRGSSGRSESVSVNKRPKEVLIVRPEHLVLRLGIFNRRVKALLVGLGDVLELEWPITTWRKRR